MSDKDDTDPETAPERLRVISLEEAEARLREQLDACEAPAERVRLTRFLAEVLARTGRHVAAKALVRDLLERAPDPGDQAQFLLRLGQLSEQIDDFEAARIYYAEGLALGAGELWIRYFLLNNLGYTLNRLGEHEEAADLCRQAMAINPEQYNAHKNLAVALEGLGRYAEAAEHYLATPDPVPPLRDKALSLLHWAFEHKVTEYNEVRDKGLAELKADPNWLKLEEGQRHALLVEHGLDKAASAPPATAEALQEALDRTPLESWADRTGALQARFDQVRMAAAKLVVPKVAPVHLPKRVIHDEAELETWLEEARRLVVARLANGPVIL